MRGVAVRAAPEGRERRVVEAMAREALSGPTAIRDSVRSGIRARAPRGPTPTADAVSRHAQAEKATRESYLTLVEK